MTHGSKLPTQPPLRKRVRNNVNIHSRRRCVSSQTKRNCRRRSRYRDSNFPSNHTSPYEACAVEARDVYTNVELGDEQLLVRGLFARLAHLKQREEQRLAGMAFLQHENDQLRTQLIQRSCGRDGGGMNDELYAHWLRQNTTLERIKAVHGRIRKHRAECGRLLGIYKMRQTNSAQRSCHDVV